MAEQTQDTSTESLLDQLQNSKDSFVRGWAADLLGERAIDKEQVLGALRNVAQSDTNKLVRDAAKSALKKLGENFQAVEIPLTNREAVRIGAQVAIVFMLLIAVFIYFVFFSLEGAIGFSIVSGLPVMLFGIIGAMIGKQWGGTKLTTRIGAIIGDILGVLGLFWFLGSKGFGQ